MTSGLPIVTQYSKLSESIVILWDGATKTELVGVFWLALRIDIAFSFGVHVSVKHARSAWSKLQPTQNFFFFHATKLRDVQQWCNMSAPDREREREMALINNIKLWVSLIDLFYSQSKTAGMFKASTLQPKPLCGCVKPNKHILN